MIDVQVMLPNQQRLEFSLERRAVISDVMLLVAETLKVSPEIVVLMSSNRLLLPMVEVSKINTRDVSALFNDLNATAEDRTKLRDWGITPSQPTTAQFKQARTTCEELKRTTLHPDAPAPEQAPAPAEAPPHVMDAPQSPIRAAPQVPVQVAPQEPIRAAPQTPIQPAPQVTDVPHATDPSFPRQARSEAEKARQSRLKHILCRINGTSMRMLIDTGAEISVLYENLLTPEMRQAICKEKASRVVGVDGIPMQSLGTIDDIVVEVDDKVTMATFSVLPGSRLTGILGIQWLEENNFMINPAGNYMVGSDGKCIYFLTDNIY